jgi:hypothetical protein
LDAYRKDDIIKKFLTNTSAAEIEPHRRTRSVADAREIASQSNLILGSADLA